MSKKIHETKQRFTIKKFKIGAASVLVGTVFATFASQAQVYANEATVPTEETVVNPAEEAAAPTTEEIQNEVASAPVEESKDETTPEVATENQPASSETPVEEKVEEKTEDTPVAPAEEKVEEKKEEAQALPKQAPVTKPTVSFKASNTLPTNPANNAQARPENEGEKISENKAFRDAGDTSADKVYQIGDEPGTTPKKGAIDENKFSKKSGIIYLLKAQPDQNDTAAGPIYEIDATKETPELVLVSTNRTTDGKTLAQSYDDLQLGLSGGKTINGLGLTGDGETAYVVYANRQNFGAIYSYNFKDAVWTLEKTRTELEAGDIPVFDKAPFTVGAFNPANEKYYFGAYDYKFNPDWSVLPNTKEEADELSRLTGVNKKYFRFWSFDPKTKEVKPAGYVDTKIERLDGVKKDGDNLLNGDIIFNENGDLLLSLDIKDALAGDANLPTTAYEVRVPFSEVTKTTDAKSTDLEMVGEGVLIGNQRFNRAFNGSALNDSDHTRYISSVSTIHAIASDLSTTRHIFGDPAVDLRFGDAAGVITYKSDLKKQYLIAGTDTIIQGAEGKVVDGVFVPSSPTALTTGDIVVASRAPIDTTAYETVAPKSIKAVNADGSVSVYRLKETNGTPELAADSAPVNGTIKREVQTVKYQYEPVVGSVEVYYKDLETGAEIKTKVDDVTNVSIANQYDTLDRKDPIIKTADGKTYQLVPNVGKVVPAGETTERDLTATDESGDIKEGTTKITYFYKEVKGSVVVNYVDEAGNKLQEPAIVTPNDTPVGTPYDASTPQFKLPEITIGDKVYELVPGAKRDVDPNVPDVTETGNTPEGPAEVTYVYREKPKGTVIVNYVDEQGNDLREKVTLKDNVPAGSPYNADTDPASKPEPKITTPDKKTYVLSPSLSVDKDKAIPNIAKDGEVPPGTSEVTYVYTEVKGNVNVNYVDQTGTSIKPSQAVKTNVPTGTEYNTATPELKPETIVTEDGKTYKLITTPDAVNSKDLNPAVENVAPSGEVKEGTTEVNYVYEEVKGSVVVNYVDATGKSIAPQATAAEEGSTGRPYDAATPALRPETITAADGKTYKLKVNENHPNDPAVADVPATGKVPTGKNEVTYVYEEVKGSVVVNYVTEDGKEIKASVTLAPEGPVGRPYDATTDELKPKRITGTDGKEYELVPNVSYNLDDNKADVSEKGTVPEGNGEVTYVYHEVQPKAQAKVVFQEVDKDGKNPKAIDNYPDVPKEGEPGDSIPTTDEQTSLEKLVEKGYKVVQNPLTNDNIFDKNPSTTQEIVVKVTPNIVPLVPGAEDPKPGQPIDPNEPNGPKYTPELIKKIEDLRTEEVSRVITYVKQETPDGEKTPITEKQTVTETLKFKQTLEINAVTGEVTAKGDWTPSETGDTFGLETSPVVEGYVASLKEVPAEKVSATDADKAVEVVYTPLGKFVPTVPPGFEVPELPVYPNDPTDPTKPGVPTTPIPYIPGLIPNGPNGEPLKPVDPTDPTKGYVPPTPEEPGKDTPIEYVKAEQKAIVTFVEEKADGSKVPVEKEISLMGESDTPIDFTSPKATVEELKKKGYTVVTNPLETPTNYDKDSKVDQSFEVVVKVTPVPVTPENPAVPGQPIDPNNPDGPKWTEENAKKVNDLLKQEVKRTITYVKIDDAVKSPVGDQAPTVEQLVTFTQTVEINPVTGEITEKGDWKADSTTTDTFPAKTSPLVKGYLAVTKEVPAETVTATDADKAVEVEYVPLAKFVPIVPPGYEVPELPVYPNDPEDPTKPGVPTDPIPHVPGLIPKGPDGKPLKPVDPEDQTKGYVPPTPEKPGKDTPIQYVVAGKVTVEYKDREGNTIKSSVTDTEAEVGTDYDTSDNRPTEIVTETGERYVLVPSLTEGKEKGQVTKEGVTVTYVYQKVANWIPEIPGVPEQDRPRLPYPFDPENPDKPIDPTQPGVPAIPHVPGFIPEGPNGEPLKPVDPTDPTKGYIPPVPEKPGKDTPIKYVEVGKVTVEYKDREGNTIKSPVVDTEGKVGTDYDTSDNRPTEIVKDGERYVLVPSLTEGKEKGQVTKEGVTVTYVYHKVANWIPEIPGVPEQDRPRLPYPFDPKNPDVIDPSKPGVPVIPYVPGFVPELPLTPVDPTDPTKGYIPPVPAVPGEDTPIKYVEAGKVTVEYKDREGNTIKSPVVDTEGKVGTDYDTSDNRPSEIVTETGERYVLVPSLTKGKEKGQVTKEGVTVTYVYQKVANWIPEIPGVPEQDRPRLPYPFDPANPDKPIDPTQPGVPAIPYVPGFIPEGPNGEPLKPVDPTDPTKGYIPPVPAVPGEDTPIIYIPVDPGKPNVPTPGQPNVPTPGNTVPGQPNVPTPGNTVPGQPNVPTPGNTVPGQPNVPTAGNTVPGQSVDQTTSPSYTKETLPNTGEESSVVTMVGVATLLGTLGLAAKARRKES